MNEKRNFSRFSFNKQIKLKTDSDEELSVSVQDLSLKGASIIVDEGLSFALGDRFSFTMVFYDDEDIIIQGDATIIWCKENSYGLQFENMGPDYFSHLKRLLELNYNDE
jgi:c-di-GMP-binding flagellar brake protein YcgR